MQAEVDDAKRIDETLAKADEMQAQIGSIHHRLREIRSAIGKLKMTGESALYMAGHLRNLKGFSVCCEGYDDAHIPFKDSMRLVIAKELERQAVEIGQQIIGLAHEAEGLRERLEQIEAHGFKVNQ